MDNGLYKVIAVDDEIWALRGLCNIVDWEAAGFSIIGSYTNSGEALKNIVSERPDIVFTDIRMPGINGMELIEAIQNSGVNARLIIVSAYRDFDVARKALSKDVTDYLMKPLDKKEVGDLLTRLRLDLDKERSSQFNIMHYDLSQKNNLNNVEIMHYLEQLSSPGFCRLAVSSGQPALSQGLLEHFTEVYVKGFRHSYLCSGLPDTEKLKSCFPEEEGLRYGISRIYSSFSELEAMLEDARESFDGCFIYSDNPKISEIQDYLSKHYSEKLSLPEIADRFFVSESYLYELFRKHTDTSVISFIKNIRLSKAGALLLEGSRTISEIADEVGYPDISYFGKLFKAKYGCTPEQYAASAKTAQ